MRIRHYADHSEVCINSYHIQWILHSIKIISPLDKKDSSNEAKRGFNG